MIMQDQLLRNHVLHLLKGGEAHLSFDNAIADFPSRLRGAKPPGAAHTAWQLLEHMRIAQWDILEFSRNPKHLSPNFPSGYWPQTEAPPDDAAWNKSVGAFRGDLASMQKIVEDTKRDLFARIEHPEAKAAHTLLREALLVADHNAYHLGQILLLRRLLGAWK
ncbi:MAG: ABC transporter [Acidobacteria bacterium]|nr:MAG: ABC transporter [Acidobacteriota bacterium]PYV37659.1 MAG: ABC transporter [Acidobacteriota bacterium]